VTSLLRLAARPVVSSIAILAFRLPALASTPGVAQGPSGFGSYLAGQEALRNLATGDAARYLHDATLAEWNNPSVVTRTFLAYLANGDIDHAVSLGRHLVELRPDFVLAKVVIATAELKDRRYDAVETLLANAPADDFAGISAAILRAWAFIGEGRRDAAFGVLDKLNGAGLGDFLAFHRALMADVAGDTGDAVNLAGKAYQASPNASRMVEAYARILGDAGRFDDALAVVKKFNQRASAIRWSIRCRRRSPRTSGPACSRPMPRVAPRRCSTALPWRSPATAIMTSRSASCSSGPISTPTTSSFRC
jgi:tetratricopeptide (TPR) repeat protein